MGQGCRAAALQGCRLETTLLSPWCMDAGMQVANHLALWNRVQGCRAAGLQAANYLALRGAGVPVSGQCVSLGALGTGHPKPERLRCAAPRKRGAGRPLPWESGTAGNWDPPPPPPKTARPEIYHIYRGIPAVPVMIFVAIIMAALLSLNSLLLY